MISQALAQESTTVTLPSRITATSLEGYLQLFLNLALLAVGVAAFVAIVYSGLIMITSNGDAAKFATGRKNLLWAVIGLIIVFLSYFIVSFVYNFFSRGVSSP